MDASPHQDDQLDTFDVRVIHVVGGPLGDYGEWVLPIINRTPIGELLGEGVRWGIERDDAGERYLRSWAEPVPGESAVIDTNGCDPGCCGLFAVIQADGDTVAWGQFRWGLGEHLPGRTFRFDRRAYEATVGSITASSPVEVDYHDAAEAPDDPRDGSDPKKAERAESDVAARLRSAISL